MGTGCFILLHLLNWPWSVYTIALRIIDAHSSQFFQYRFILYELGNCLLTHHLADFIDRSHHCLVDVIVDNRLHEGSIDFQEMHWEVLKISK